jgi:molybdopterin-containing oxidoreductase family iron-sulfur binding subunit
MALIQGHQSMEGRPIVRESTLEKWKKNPAAGNELHEEIKHHHTTLYEEKEYKGHKWGMAIDLGKCIGCSACVLACNTENNIPVVGKKEAARHHEMHWIRIDRYYNGDEENPEVVRQPVMCQHCDNAPCENVCPVAATNHSSEGLNQMAYNRCIGTRYCNNNCPYKVRRFNWLDYTGADAIPNNRYDPASMTLDLSRMRHNPDVTVRAKGVIEKCSFCVQRIQEKKLTAKNNGRQLEDGELQPACQQACPADAIVFGDLNDPNSKVSKMMKDPRNYHLLEELHTLPSVGYLTKIRNKS